MNGRYGHGKKKEVFRESGFIPRRLSVVFPYSNITEMKSKETNWTDKVREKSD